MTNQDPGAAPPAKLTALSGLPGAGTSRIARVVDAVYLRIDSIQQSLRDSPALFEPMSRGGYRLGYFVAAHNLKLRRSVVDFVNPIATTRDAWRDVARAGGSAAVRNSSQMFRRPGTSPPC